MKGRIQVYIKKWESRCYSDGVPDEAPHRLESLNKVPSYRLICKAIMKNDSQLKTLGYSRKKTLIYDEIKRIELTERGVINQLRLF
jgi:predicted phosphoadenosine phosphosulfate sulfurtransferase